MNDLEDACLKFLTHCEYERKLSPLTIKAYRGDLGCFTRIVGPQQKLVDISEQWIERAVRTWSSDPDLKTVTVKRRAACIKALIRWLFRRRHIQFNPLERLELEFRIPKRLPRNLQTGEIRQIIAVRPEIVSEKFRPAAESLLSRQEWDRLTARLAIEVLTLTGIRIGELSKVQMIDFDQYSGLIRIRGKGNRERQVSFPDSVTTTRLQLYREHVKLRFGPECSKSLLVNGLGRMATEQYFRRVIRNFAQEANVPRRVTPHMLRHTAATQLLEAGLDIRLVQRVLGHASVTTTEIYTHVADHVLRREVSRVNIRERLEMD